MNRRNDMGQKIAVGKDKRVTVYFSGDVQGVGFRFTARDAASRRGVAGFVKNLSDGRVELVAEGTESELRSLLGDIKERMAGHIGGADEQWEFSSGEFRRFEIRF